MDATESEFKITGPGEYVTRDGRKATVEFMLPGKGEAFPWIGWIDDPFPRCSTWSDGGMNCSTYPGPNDIVGHWVEPRKPMMDYPLMAGDKYVMWFGLAVIVIVATWVVVTVFSVLIQ